MRIILGGLRVSEKPSLTQQDQVVQMIRSGPDGLDLAVQTLQKNSDPRLREVAAYVIGEYGKRELARVLSDTLTDPSEQVRRSAITALQKLVNPELLSQEPTKVFRAMDVPALPPPQSLPPNVGELCSALQPLLRDRSPLVRAPAAETIGWLQCNSSVPDLQELMHDPFEPVRFRASHALEILTGQKTNFIDLDAVVWAAAPLMAIRRGREANEAQQAAPFVRSAFYEVQGKFSFRGGIPAQYQTVLRAWWTEGQLEFQAECEDERPGTEGDDRLTFFLKPEGESKLYQFEVVPARGLIRQAVETVKGREEGAELNARASVERSDHEWKAHLQVPFEAFGLHSAPAGKTWEANVVRVESHRATWGNETSSWAYFDRNFPGPPRLGHLYFAEHAPVLGFRPAPEDVYVFPFDGNEFSGNQTHPIQPAVDTLWGDIVAPDHLARGVNTFLISQKFKKAGQPPLRLTVTASDYEDRKVVNSQTSALPGQSKATTRRVEFNLPEATRSRAVNLEVVISEDDAQNSAEWHSASSSSHDRHELLRTRFICVPVVTPPNAVTSYHPSIVEDEKGFWKAHSTNAGEWVIRDYGPMLMSESYPMGLLEDQHGTIYGGTYPGGRLFSFNPATGVLEDLGSPSQPANHLVNLVASSDDRLYGGLNRPRGASFAYDLKRRTSVDLGVPVSGGIIGECSVMTYAGGRAYGIQRGHLFFIESATDRIVDKGSFFLNGKRYLPSLIASDTKGNLLGIAGGRLFRYSPGSDEIRITASMFDGWLLSGPQGKLYTLFLDGRLFRWEPEKDEFVQVTRYALIAPGEGPMYNNDPFRGVQLVLTGSGELVVARSGMDDLKQTSVWVYGLGGSQPINLGNPVAGSLFLTALISGSNNTVYGLSTQYVYGLDRTPVHLYSIVRVGRKARLTE